MTGMIGLDFETFGDVDLTVHGLQRYTEGEHFRPLIACIARNVRGGYPCEVFDFVDDYTESRLRLIEAIGNNTIVAHNAGFEQAVLAHMDIILSSDRFIDSAVLARALGAAGKLEAAAPQLLGIDKMASGWELIKLFSIPKDGQVAFDPQIVADNPAEWKEFAEYCMLDAELSLRLVELAEKQDREMDSMLVPFESQYNAITMDMNNVGWHVDMDLVRNMQLRYLTNVANAEAEFRKECNAQDLNLNSHKQLTEWCAERGVKATSFDEAHVARMLKSINKRLESDSLTAAKRAKLLDVRQLLWTKQIMGGSSLKKLQTIIDTTGTDDRLRDQYLHCGAGATFRTTGRGVQMQNLKRLNGEGNDMAELWVEDTEWDNTKLASNLRQVFTATDPDGFLIVGDFSSVESRGLAWQASETWKLDAYSQGKDLYKVQAGVIFGKHEAHVTKAERQIGKVGELACGYGAGAGAVKDFAAKMGVEMTEGEAGKLVRDWRAANPRIVDYWRMLDDALHQAVEYNVRQTVFVDRIAVEIVPVLAPASLRKQTGNENLRSLWIGMGLKNGNELFSRVIHGVYLKGGNIQHWKPSDRKTGDLWSDFWVNPKTKRPQPYTVYGGKLSGLLTQSLCREVFFAALTDVHNRLVPFRGVNVQLVGQFHDEIVLDWAPGAVTLEGTKDMLTDCMTRTTLPGFPLAAEIKHDYRYTK
jgi:DNA polymerase